MFKQIAVAAALVVATSSACAQQAGQFYVGADVKSTKADDSDRESGHGAFVGYQFHKNFAVEAGYHRLIEVEVPSFDAGDGISYAGDGKTDQTSLSVVASLPFSNGISLYGRLGVNHLKVKGNVSVTENNVTETGSYSDSETKVLYGAGVAYAFTPTFQVRFEVQKPHGDLTTYVTGAVFSF